MNHLNISIVLYNNPFYRIEALIKKILSTKLDIKVYLIDNSSNDFLSILSNSDKRIIYIYNNSNLGFGKAHNIALLESIKYDVPYHAVLNPDIYFDTDVFDFFYQFMELNKDVALAMPKILYPDNSIQYLCKLLPSPIDLISRRFFNLSIIRKLFANRNDLFELRFTGYNHIMNVPYLSGCFMFLRTAAIKEVGLFDENFFLYLEDTDLSRRLHKKYRTVFYPFVEVYHEHQKGSYKSLRLLYHHISSAIYYFNKWGWFFDHERKQINQNVLKELGYYNSSFPSLPAKS